MAEGVAEFGELRGQFTVRSHTPDPSQHGHGVTLQQRLNDAARGAAQFAVLGEQFAELTGTGAGRAQATVIRPSMGTAAHTVGEIGGFT
ncbi:MAG: hypothetical protein WBB05_26335 [Mycolicibacterium fortuitum]